MEDHAPPPEAVLIEQLRRESLGVSIARAAADAEISESRWRQIAKGYQQATKDTRIPVVAPADTLARMAHIVGATAQQLREAGRPDAADELEKLIARSDADKLALLTGGIFRESDDDYKPGREPLRDLIATHMASANQSPIERANLMVRSLGRSVANLRGILVHGRDDAAARAGAIDALAAMEVAVDFLAGIVDELRQRDSRSLDDAEALAVADMIGANLADTTDVDDSDNGGQQLG